MFELSKLPYEAAALEPIISEKTISFHYGKHHQAYVDNLNKLLPESGLENMSLEEIIKESAGKQDRVAIFNNAAQVYNHDFFWSSLAPSEKAGRPEGPFLSAIESAFGTLENLITEIKTAALSQFGSGWAWLVKDGEALKVIKTANAENPLASGLKPIIAIDVWEHSYYLDYQNKRADYLDAVLANLIDWQSAAKRFE